MPTSEEATTINRSPAVVWAYLTVTENVPTFENQVIYLDQMTPGPVGLGTRWRGAHNVLGRTVEWTTEVVEFEPCRRMVVRSIEGKFAFTVVYTLDPDEAGGTTLMYRIDADPGLGGVFGTLTDRFVGRAFSRTVRTNLAILKELLEVDA